MLNGGTERHAFPCYQSEEMKIINVSCPRMGIEPTSCHFRSYACPLHDYVNNDLLIKLLIALYMEDI